MTNALIIFIYSIFAYGLANMMVFGSGPFRIFERIRNLTSSISDHFGLLFSCMMCLPANIGLFFSLLDWFVLKNVAIAPFNILLAGTGLWWLAIIMDCCFTSGIVWFIHHVETFFENLGGGNDDSTNNDDDIIEVEG